MVLMVQVSASSKEDRLTEMEERILKTMNIKLVYVRKFASKELENFYGLVMEKFRILSLTDYSRVMFFDYDIFPICNLDYIFDLTEPVNPPHLLNENVILGWKNEPCNAGLFVLRPNQADYKRLGGIILAKERRALQLPFPHWDEEIGWGHTITEEWVSPAGTVGTHWTWAYAYADQGLL
jgi:alpha-N-acetylglucosamine transferase